MSIEPQQGWTQKTWNFRPKHRKATVETWKSGEAKEWSGQKGAHSQYNPLIYDSDSAVEAAEVECVEKGTQIFQNEEKRTFYQELTHIVGVCSGEDTVYIYAEWHNSGAVHGRPISVKALRRMGVKR